MRTVLSFFLFYNIFVGYIAAQASEPVLDANEESLLSTMIETIFKESDHVGLCKILMPNIAIDILEYCGQYSSKQVSIIVKDFFAAQPIKNFTVVKQGKSSATGDPFLVGLYEAEGTSYDVFMRFKKEASDKFSICKLNIRKKIE